MCTWPSAIPTTFSVLCFLTSCHKENNSPKGIKRNSQPLATYCGHCTWQKRAGWKSPNFFGPQDALNVKQNKTLDHIFQLAWNLRSVSPKTRELPNNLWNHGKVENISNCFSKCQQKSLAPNPQGELSTYPEEGQRLLKAVSDQAALGEPFRLQLYK